MSSQQDLTLGQPGNGQGLTPGALRQMHELWLVLAKRDWASITLVPADPAGSMDELARGLATVGKNLSDVPVSAVTVKVLGAGSARALAALAKHVRGRQNKRLWHGNGVIEVTAEESRSADEEDGYMVPPAGQVVLGIPSVVAEPLALAVIQATDAVVLGVELGKTSMKDIRRSVDLIGREHIAGCVLL